MDKNHKEALKRIKNAKKENSTHLVLSNLYLTELPEKLFELTELKTLDLWRNQLTTLPKAIGELTYLTELDLDHNQLKTLPETLGKLAALTKLDLNNNKLTILPKAIGKLTQLTRLSLHTNSLETVPEIIGELTALTELDLSDNKITILPKTIGKLTQLTELSLNANSLETLSETIGELTALTELDLGNNKIITLPKTIGKLTRLTELILNNNLLTTLPETIEKLSQLNILNLDKNQLTIAPKAIGELVNLKRLDLDENDLWKFPKYVEKLTNLEVLYLDNNQLATLPESIGKLTGLTELHLEGNQLTTLPESIGNLAELTELDLNKNQLTTLPETVGKLSKLSSLNLDNNRLSIFPTPVWKLANLKRLDFDNNELATLPESIEKLTGLEVLYLDGNRLVTLPKGIFKLAKLTELNLDNNRLTTLPKAIARLTRLTSLDLEGNRLTALPETIGELAKLVSLNLDFNKLTTLPKEIVKLAELKALELEGNGLNTLPETIGELTALTLLNLENNQLIRLPEGFQELANLNRLRLIKNDFKVGSEVYELTPKEQIREILKWQRAQQEGTLRPIHEAKVIFIGESNFGKTHLIEFLREGEIRRKITTTHGIERSHINVPFQDEAISLNIWDLGGQEFMRSTHQFFFSERTLYVLVTLARRERSELNHWLKLADQLGNKAPVLVVINKIDLDTHDLDRRSLERDYPNIVGFVRTCINDCDEGKAGETLEQLKEKITAIVSDKNKMPGVFEQRPPDWFTVKNQLEELEAEGTNFITYQEYQNLKFIKNLEEEERKSNLKLLSMIGTVVSFVDDPRLIDTNVINPQWIMDGVYAIINDPKVKDEAKGHLNIDDLARILPTDKFPKERHAYLLELMNKFDLCYAAKDQHDVYFIPDLFEDIEPEAEWDGENSMHFRYNYDDFSPDVFMTRFIVEMHQDIQDEKRWRSGVYISNGSCQAKVYQTYRKNYIHIEVLGNKGEGRSYLYAIRETFRKLHKPFPQMEIKQEALYKGYWLNYLQLINREAKNKPWYHDELDEDLPVISILNGYSTDIDRRGRQKHIKIFLASSNELKQEREQFEIFIHRENQQWYKKGIFIELELWENSIDAISQTRLQDEYNNVIKHSDIFVSLFFTKVGKYTEEEFTTAFGQFKKTGKPLVYTYFKNASIDTEDITEDIQSLLNFRKRIKALGHFRTIYNNTDDLKLQFKNQLEKILPKL